jgi:hypothetical protein
MRLAQRTALVVMPLLLFTGCSRTTHWTRPETQERYFTPEERQQFYRDRYACVQESRVGWSAGGTGAAGAVMIGAANTDARNESDRLFAYCMEARGYIQRGKNGVPTLDQISKP